MIEGYCFTNLDEYQREIWPNEFVSVPRTGELIESDNGKLLKVSRVIHTTFTNRIPGLGLVTKPTIKVELEKL